MDKEKAAVEKPTTGGRPPGAEQTVALTESPARPWRRSLFPGIGGALLLVGGALVVLLALVVTPFFPRYRNLGEHMEPNLHDGQYLIVNSLVYYLRQPERGDVIVFRSPANPRKYFIKRVVALPGEEVGIQHGQVLINGAQLEETCTVVLDSDSWGPEVVGEFEYFVLGDNRRNSSDSRHWGMLDGGAIIGKAWICYWPPQYWGIVPRCSLTAGE